VRTELPKINFENYLLLDFEFNKLTHEKVNLVSCVTHDLKTKETKKFWLHNSKEEKQKLISHLKKYKYIMGYACVAEARCFYSLGLNPLDFEWLDLYLEYKMVSNHNDELNWGKQLVNGVVKYTKKPPPKWERTEEDKAGFKPTHSLAEATYKLTGEIRDTEEKTNCRNLIISDPKKFTDEERRRILKYNALDVEFLPRIFEEILKHFYELKMKDVDWEEYFEEAHWRGRYAAHTAIMESIGYPINYEATKNFSSKIPSILAECQRDINSQFNFKPFKWHRKTQKFSWNQNITRKWLVDNGYSDSNWMLTEKEQLSLSLEAFERHFQYRHDYPRGNFGAQMLRFLKLKQSLYGFSEPDKNSKKKSFWDSVGPDKRVRPYMNIYGAQSGRSQPAATGFMFLKPAWMRALVEPEKGKFLFGIDYGQQEFFIAALLSGDQEMIKAYLSGDPYLYMGKRAGAIPEDGTKKTHSDIRDMFKSTTLGILFMMTKYGLSEKLTADTGRVYSKDEAQGLIDIFEGLFPDFISWREDTIRDYERDGITFKTLDGWPLWLDNDNARSVGNVPVQGAGASIMRKAVDIAVSRGIRITYTLHDAIYGEANENQLDHIKILMDSMRDAFRFYFEDTEFEAAANQIKLDPKAWGPCFPEKGEIKVKGITIPVSRLYIDGRAQSEYDRFSKYFNKSETDLF
jgi:hypothetical protein